MKVGKIALRYINTFEHTFAYSVNTFGPKKSGSDQIQIINNNLKFTTPKLATKFVSFYHKLCTLNFANWFYEGNKTRQGKKENIFFFFSSKESYFVKNKGNKLKKEKISVRLP